MLKLRGQGVAACVSRELADGTGIVKDYDFSLTVHTAGTALENGPMFPLHGGINSMANACASWAIFGALILCHRQTDYHDIRVVREA